MIKFDFNLNIDIPKRQTKQEIIMSIESVKNADVEIIVEENEINSTNIHKYIDVIDTMIYDLAVSTEEYIPFIISDLAKYYDVKYTYLVKLLKSIKSEYTANNNIVFYYNDKPYRRTAFTCAQRKVMNKLGDKLQKTYFGLDDATQKFMENIGLLLSINPCFTN